MKSIYLQKGIGMFIEDTEQELTARRVSKLIDFIEELVLWKGDVDLLLQKHDASRKSLEARLEKVEHCLNAMKLPPVTVWDL